MSREDGDIQKFMWTEFVCCIGKNNMKQCEKHFKLCLAFQWFIIPLYQTLQDKERQTPYDFTQMWYTEKANKWMN